MAEESTHRPDPHLADTYPETGVTATPALRTIIAAEIKKNGAMPFPHFMELALYHPQLGYYSSDTQKTGKQGDFITSVSVGSCFGIILARRLHQYWKDAGAVSDFRIIEPGAHDGTLAKDILDEVKRLSEDFYQSIHYHLVETSSFLRGSQSTKLSNIHEGKFTTHASMQEIHTDVGAVISNELVDAFPVELVRFINGQWQRQMVALDDEGEFIFENGEPGDLSAFFNSLGSDYPEGYTTEFNSGISEFVRSASRLLGSGLFLTIDYGHLHHDYYHPDRTTGTLQTYHSHQKAENPLLSPGEIDITAHVDFTHLQKTAESSGFHHPWFGTQASYLTEHARDWLLDMEKNPVPSNAEFIRQFQTLTHPSMLGTRFSVLEMRK